MPAKPNVSMIGDLSKIVIKIPVRVALRIPEAEEVVVGAEEEVVMSPSVTRGHDITGIEQKVTLLL